MNITVTRFALYMLLVYLFCGTMCAGADSPFASALAKLAADPENRTLLEEMKSTVPKLTDSSERVRCMTIYALGCMVVGDTAAGESIRSYLLKRFADDPDTACLKPENLSSKCVWCNGEGTRVARCAECGGTANCGSCLGTGQLVTKGMNGARTIRCLKCRGLGSCPSCKRTGEVTSQCVECKGRGLTPSISNAKAAYYRLLGKGKLQSDAVASANHSSGGNSAWTQAEHSSARRPASTSGTMAEYVAAVKLLRNMYREGNIQNEPLADVISSSSDYVGKVIGSIVYIIEYHPRAISVSAEPGPNSESRITLYPDTVWIGGKAGKLLKKHGSAVPLRAVFGQLNADQNVLFEIDEIKEE